MHHMQFDMRVRVIMYCNFTYLIGYCNSRSYYFYFIDAGKTKLEKTWELPSTLDSQRLELRFAMQCAVTMAAPHQHTSTILRNIKSGESSPANRKL